MKTDSLNITGSINIERLSSLPSWDPSFVGRLIYNTADNTIYVGKATSFEAVGGGSPTGDIPQYNLGPFDQFHIITEGVIVSLKADYPGLEPGVGLVYVCPRDFIKAIHGGVGTITFEISKDGGSSWQSSTSPNGCWVDFGCPHLGMQVVNIRATDSDTPPSVTRTEVWVTIQDPLGICPI